MKPMVTTNFNESARSDREQLIQGFVDAWIDPDDLSPSEHKAWVERGTQRESRMRMNAAFESLGIDLHNGAHGLGSAPSRSKFE